MLKEPFIGPFYILNGIHLIKVACLNTGLLIVKGVYAVIDCHIKHNTVMNACIGGRDAVACRVVITRAYNLLAPYYYIITCIFPRKTKLSYEPRDDHIIILEQGQTAAHH